MGLLKVGRPLTWEEALEHLKYVREHGIEQFLHTYETMKDMKKAELKWGEEIECGVFKIDREKHTVRLSLRAPEILSVLQAKEMEYEDRFEGCTWQPEFGSWMIESTPNRPFTGYAADLLRVEPNMRLRRKRLLSVLQHDEICPLVTAFPLMGVGIFTEPPYPPGGPVSISDSVPDACINPHPRFATLVRNIRTRRGRKVDIRMPLFRDKHTPEYAHEPPEEPAAKAKRAVVRDPEAVDADDGFVWQLDGVDTTVPVSPVGPGVGFTNSDGHDNIERCPDGRPAVVMDAMAYGMGCCCLQVTFQARDVDESRFLYDQLAVLAPIMLSLTAATPILKGRLVDTDVRWDTIAGAVDCRTRAEMGEDDGATPDPRLAGGGVRRISKSRYSSISCYIYSCPEQPRADSVLERYDDVPVEVDEELQAKLEARGVDHILARHVAHLFIRDPLVIFDGSIAVDDSATTEHFENIQSTNWNTVRWKPPPPASPSPCAPRIGWRTEFRSMEIQLTDFENAAYTVFVVLLTRVILAFDLHLYIPISKLDENMCRAHKRDSALKEKFFFRKAMANDAGDGSAPSHCFCSEVNQYEEMSIGEIMTGKGTYFPGLIPLCHAYLEYIRADKETSRQVRRYLDFIQKRATGELPTAAAWIRGFVTRHPDYKQDSVIPESVAYDLLMECKAIGEGAKDCAELLGDIKIERIKTEEAYDVLLSSSRLVSSERHKVIERYLRRCSFSQRRMRSHRSLNSSDTEFTDGSETSQRSGGAPFTPLDTNIVPKSV